MDAMPWLRDRYIIIVLAILFISIIAIPRIIFPDLEHGDEFSDASTLMSGKNFVKFGFIKCRFLPVFDPHLDKPANLYTHAPPMSDITNGVLRKIFKIDSLRFFREVALLCSLLNLLIWYLLIKKLTRSYLISFLAALFYFSNTFFIFGADSLYQNAYADFLRVLIIYIYITVINFPQKRKIGLFFLFLLLTLETLFTFEYIVYLSLFFFIVKFFYRGQNEKFPIKYILILFLAPVFGVALHFLKNSWYFGSASLAFKDMTSIAVERIGYSKDSPIVLNFPNWWRYVISRNFSLAFLFNYSILFSFIFFSFILYHNLSPESKKEIKRLLRLCILFLICGITWYIAFPSHTLAHTYVLFLVRHLVPAAALAFTLFCYIAYSFIRENNPHNLFGKSALIIIIVIIVLTGILKSELPIGKNKIMWTKDFLVFKQCLLSLRGMGNGKEPIGVNYYRNPFMRYYANRQCRAIFDKASLEKSSPLPQYFILMLYNNPSNQELYQYLSQKYVFLFQCHSGRFPSIFFKLKE